MNTPDDVQSTSTKDSKAADAEKDTAKPNDEENNERESGNPSRMVTRNQSKEKTKDNYNKKNINNKRKTEGSTTVSSPEAKRNNNA